MFKVKEEASGWPLANMTAQEKQEHIDQVYAHERVRLDPSKIEVNKGKRQLGKLFLNSMWGKLAQRSNLNKCEYFNEPSQFFTSVTDPQVTVSDVNIVGQDLVRVRFEHKELFQETLGNTNVCLAALTTSYARYVSFLML